MPAPSCCATGQRCAPRSPPLLPLRPSRRRRARLGLDGGAALDLASPADALLRAAVEDLEGSNRGLAAENQRLRVELVRALAG